MKTATQVLHETLEHLLSMTNPARSTSGHCEYAGLDTPDGTIKRCAVGYWIRVDRHPDEWADVGCSVRDLVRRDQCEAIPAHLVGDIAPEVNEHLDLFAALQELHDHGGHWNVDDGGLNTDAALRIARIVSDAGLALSDEMAARVAALPERDYIRPSRPSADDG